MYICVPLLLFFASEARGRKWGVSCAFGRPLARRGGSSGVGDVASEPFHGRVKVIDPVKIEPNERTVEENRGFETLRRDRPEIDGKGAKGGSRDRRRNLC